MAKKKLGGPRLGFRQSVFSNSDDALGYLIESKQENGRQLHHVALLSGGTKWFDDHQVRDYKEALAKAKDPEKVKRLEAEIQAFASKESQ